MLKSLRALLGGKQSAAPRVQAAPTPGPAAGYMEVLLLGEFEKPRRVRSVAYGWDDHVKHSLIKTLLDKGDLAIGTPTERIGKAWTVEQLKARLAERGQGTAGRKPDLVARLLSCDPHVADGVATDVMRYTPAGKARLEEWRKPIDQERRATATLALAALARREVSTALKAIENYWNRFPPLRHFASQGAIEIFHAYDQRNVPKIEAVLRAAPSTLSELSVPDLQRTRLAAAIWYAGLPHPGASMALHGYTGKIDLETLLRAFRDSWSDG